jgi:hypothetical protein
MIIRHLTRNDQTIESFFQSHIRSLQITAAPMDDKFRQSPAWAWFSTELSEWSGRPLIDVPGFGSIGVGFLATVVYLRNLRELFGEGIFPLFVQSDFGTTLTGAGVPGTYVFSHDQVCEIYIGGEIEPAVTGVVCTGTRVLQQSHYLRAETSLISQLHNLYGGCYVYDDASGALSFPTNTQPVAFWGAEGDHARLTPIFS